MKCKCTCGKYFKNRITMQGHMNYASFVCKGGIVKPSLRHKLDLNNCEVCIDNKECNLLKEKLIGLQKEEI